MCVCMYVCMYACMYVCVYVLYMYVLCMCVCMYVRTYVCMYVRGLLEKYPTFGREKETGLLGALDT